MGLKEVKNPKYNGLCVYPNVKCILRTCSGFCHKINGAKCRESEKRVEYNKNHLLDGLGVE